MNNKFIARGIIKFKDSKIKRFAYGYYAKIEGKHYIILNDAQLEQIENTCVHGICGFVEIIQEPDRPTGLKDKNGKFIYERDTVLCGYFDEFNTREESEEIYNVIWNEESARFQTSEHCYFECDQLDNGEEFIEIIGNMHNIKHKE